MSAKTFERLAGLAEVILAAEFPVIVDGTFLHRSVRDNFLHLAQRLGVPFAILHCVADPDELRKRLLTRASSGSDASEADVKVMEQQKMQLEPLANEELDLAVVIDSGTDAGELWETLCRRPEDGAPSFVGCED